jgi:outer membrane protein assembly factor BamB
LPRASNSPKETLTVKCNWVFLILALTAAAETQAANWPQWRGPSFNGATDEKNLPSHWSKTENIAWSDDLAGAAAATPIVWDDRVFLSGVDQAKDTLLAMCFDRVGGKLLWSHEVGKGIRRDSGSNYASASPVTDGQLVIFLYGNGDLVCFDVAGSRRWTRNIQKDYGPFAFYWTIGTSPLLYEGKLYVQVLQRDVPVEGRGLKDRENEAYLLAIDPATGKTLWRHVRPSQAAVESRESHTTPIPWLHAGQRELLIAGGDALSGHDPTTGEERWRWDRWNPSRTPHWPLIASPVAGSGVALVCVPKGQPVYAIAPGKSGTLDDSAVAWSSREAKRVTSEVPTPAYYDGDFFVLSDSRRSLARLASDTGRVKWLIPAPGHAKYEASPLAADGKIYLVNFDGIVSVVSAASGKVLRLITMDQPADGEMVRASISAAHGQLFIRTTRKLYCVGKGQ